MSGQSSTGKTLLKWLLAVGILIGGPIFVSSDRVLTWIFDQAWRDQWTRAPEVTYDCAQYLRWTARTERAAEVYEALVERWPEHSLVPDAAYYVGVSLRDVADELAKEARGDPEKIAKKLALREEAMQWFAWMGSTYPAHDKASVARRAAQEMNLGY